MRLAGIVGESKKLIFPVAFWHLCPSCTAISIKCSPWGTNNNKQLLVDALCQHVPFALSPLLNSQPANTVGSQPDLKQCDALVCACLIRALNSYRNRANARNRDGHYGEKLCKSHACQTAMISSDCLVLLVMKLLHNRFYRIHPVIFPVGRMARRRIRILLFNLFN